MRRTARSSLSLSLATSPGRSLGKGVAALAAAAALAATAALALPANAATTASGTPARVAPGLADELTGMGAAEKATVLVHGSDLAAANTAVSDSGMAKLTSFDKIAVVVARGTTDQISEARATPASPTSRATRLSSSARRPRTPRRGATR